MNLPPLQSPLQSPLLPALQSDLDAVLCVPGVICVNIMRKPDGLTYTTAFCTNRKDWVTGSGPTATVAIANLKGQLK